MDTGFKFALETDVPSPPAAIIAIIEATNDPASTMQRLGTLASTDPILSAQILKLANSSLYARGAQIRSMGRAVSVLGVRSLRNLALCVAVRTSISRKELGTFNLDEFWHNSLARGLAGRLLVEKLRLDTIDATEAFTCGLMQDIGVLALVRRRPSLSGEWLACAGLTPRARRDHEREIFGESHDDINRKLARVWHLPAEIAMPMQYHHTPSRAPYEHRERSMLANRAELLAEVLSADDTRRALVHARRQLHDTYGMAPEEVDEILTQLGEQIGTFAHELGFRLDRHDRFSKLLEAANNGLVDLGSSYEELTQQLQQARAENEALRAELAERNGELAQLCLTDTLTGLPNGRALSGRVRHEVRRAARGGVAQFFTASIDKFATIADTPEHTEQILKHVARTLAASVRDVDMVGRCGATTFGILLVGTDTAGAKIACERVLRAVRDHPLQIDDEAQVQLSVTIGGAMIEGPYRGRLRCEGVGRALYRRADRSLQQAVERGGDQLVHDEESLVWEELAAAA